LKRIKKEWRKIEEMEMVAEREAEKEWRQ